MGRASGETSPGTLGRISPAAESPATAMVRGSWRDLDVAVPLQGPVGARWETISAGAVLINLPTLTVFLFLQRFIRTGLMPGATK
ncbi:hypothetical protein ABZV51_19790 [Streptomyces avermitilis]